MKKKIRYINRILKGLKKIEIQYFNESYIFVAIDFEKKGGG